MKAMPPATRMTVAEPRPAPVLMSASTQPMGTRQASVTPATQPIGRSCSVRGSVAPWPALRTREAAIAEARPVATGLTSLISVQIAATAMAPAPMKRTCLAQTWLATPATSALASKGSRLVRCGTAPAQEISTPTSMATPTHRPTRWPTASSASERPKSTPVDALLLRLRRK